MVRNMENDRPKTFNIVPVIFQFNHVINAKKIVIERAKGTEGNLLSQIQDKINEEIKNQGFK